MSAFEQIFRVPDGHSLRLVAPSTGAEARQRAARWEHEEYDPAGMLIAVYESWRRTDGSLAFVKYSPQGWVLSVSGRSPRLVPERAKVRVIGAT